MEMGGRCDCALHGSLYVVQGEDPWTLMEPGFH